MSWFHKICRNVGLMIHNVRRPGHETRVVRRDVQEEKRGRVTLRRTTIEEMEIDGEGEGTKGQRDEGRN